MARNHACSAVAMVVGIMAMIAHVDCSILNRRIQPTEAKILNIVHTARRMSECICATNMGIYACSETSFKTVAMCMMSFCTKSAGTASAAKTKDNTGKYLCGMMYGLGVSLYHESACMFGCQQSPRVFGPNVMALPTSHAHRLADKTKNILIFESDII